MGINSFNFIAPFYDLLAKVVFGDNLEKASVIFLDKIQKNHNVLILGGGTGKLISSLPKANSIHYLEKSEKMIHRAKQKHSENELTFINIDFLAYEPSHKYDVIVCPFFLDCFSDESLKNVIFKIKELLKKDGLMIVTDFDNKNQSRFLMKVMHLFFRITANLESKSLSNIHQYVCDNGFQLVNEIFLHRKQVFSRLYRNL